MVVSKSLVLAVVAVITVMVVATVVMVTGNDGRGWQ